MDSLYAKSEVTGEFRTCENPLREHVWLAKSHSFQNRHTLYYLYNIYMLMYTVY